MDLSKSNLDLLYEFVCNNSELYRLFYENAQKHSEKMLKEAFDSDSGPEGSEPPQWKEKPSRDETRENIIKCLHRHKELTVHQMRKMEEFKHVPSSEMNSILNRLQGSGRVKRTNKKGEKLSYYWAWVELKTERGN